MTHLDALLAVQELDTAADQLRHRRANFPERAELARLQAELSTIDLSLKDTGERRRSVERDQRRLEDEIDTVNAKAVAVDKTLYSGTVSNPRELQAMQDDIESLRRRQRHLEDQVLEVMEVAEPIDVSYAALEARKGVLDAEVAAVTAVIAEAEAEIDGQLADLDARRTAAAEPLDADLLGEYEKLRDRMGGIGVARLVGANCGGCHLTLAAVELDEIRHLPPDGVAYCSACGRLLVR